MIITRYALVVEIEGNKYNIVYSPLTHKNRKELEKAQKAIVDKNKGLDKKKKDLQFKREDYVLNSELLQVEKASKKADLIKEQKALKKEIYDLECQIEEEATKIDPVQDDLEKLQEQYFDMCISGDDVEKLKAVIAESDVNYDIAVQEIEKLAKEESEKK